MSSYGSYAAVCRLVMQKHPWKIRKFGPYLEGNVFDTELESLRQKAWVEKLEEHSQVPDQPIQISEQRIAPLHKEFVG